VASKHPGTTGPRPLSVSRTIQASTFKATCLDLMDEVAASHVELVVTKHGRPVVKVGPVADIAPASPFGFLQGTVIGYGDIVAPDHESWRTSGADPLDLRTR
jgi:prevent-host-death family protein